MSNYIVSNKDSWTVEQMLIVYHMLEIRDIAPEDYFKQDTFVQSHHIMKEV